MLLKQIRYFVTVVEEHSFTEAAEQLYISQSAVSQSVQALEKELDTRLILRKNRSFSLTPAGEYFYRKGKTLLAGLDELRNETVRIGREEEGELCIGYLNLYSGVGAVRDHRGVRRPLPGGAHLHGQRHP